MKDQTHELEHNHPRPRCCNCEERTNIISVLVTRNTHPRETRKIYVLHLCLCLKCVFRNELNFTNPKPGSDISNTSDRVTAFHHKPKQRE